MRADCVLYICLCAAVLLLMCEISLGIHHAPISTFFPPSTSSCIPHKGGCFYTQLLIYLETVSRVESL